MRGGLRTITILMLLAGVCLGVFAGKLAARKPQAATPILDPRVENQVRYWRERYELNAEDTDRIRMVLLRMREQSRGALLDLRHEHPERFQAISQEAQTKIRAILGSDPANGR